MICVLATIVTYLSSQIDGQFYHIVAIYNVAKDYQIEVSDSVCAKNDINVPEIRFKVTYSVHIV